MKRALLPAVFLCFLFIMPRPLLAQDIALDLSCKDGGTIRITGTWEPSGGNAALLISTTDCAHNGTLLVGNGTVNGTVLLNTVPTSATVSLATLFNGTLSRNGEEVAVTYNQSASGEYGLLSEVLTGELESTWKANGSIDIDVLHLLSINMADTFF